jgi:hypothetical protein
VAEMIQNLKEEAERWNLLKDQNVCVKTLGGEAALVMPYVRPIREEELKEKTKKEAIQCAAKDMIEHDLIHDAVHLRHVGFFSPRHETYQILPNNLRKKTEESRAVFFDLAHMTKIGKEEEVKERAFVQMMQNLGLSD